MDKKTTIQSDILKDLGFSDLPQDKKEGLVVKMTEVLLKQMFLGAMDKLNSEDKAAFEKLVRGMASQDEIEKFLKEKINDYDAVLEKIMADFKQEMKKGIIV